MKIYKLRKCGGKTYRDMENAHGRTLYHVSSEKLSFLSGRSVFNGKSGLYFSQSYKSTIKDWAFYVQDKKSHNDPIDSRWNELFNKRYKLEAQLVASGMDKDAINLELSDLDREINRLRGSRNKTQANDPNLGYKTLYIHSVFCPKEVYERNMSMMMGLLDQEINDGLMEKNPNRAFGFWSWGEQVFIISEDLDQLKILNVKTFNVSDLLNEYANLNLVDRRRGGMSPWERDWHERNKESKT